MLDSAAYRKLRNGKPYDKSKERTMSDHGSTKENVTGFSTENVGVEISEFQTSTQESVNEQIGRFIVPLTRQLDNLTQPVQGIMTTQHPEHYLRTDVVTTSGTATYQSDMVTTSTRIQNRRQKRTSHDTDDETTYNDHDR